ncbi:MAG: glycosyltransferase [Saprospiraceae bacterium]|nr:glycosyltransferase [Saprospiraceae bacterium]
MDIVCLAFPAWKGNYLKSTVQLMSELAKNHRVLYVDYAYTWKDFAHSIRGKSFAEWQRMAGLESRLQEVNLDNGAALHVLTLPPVVPTNFIKNPKIYDVLNHFNAFFLEKTIKKALKTLDFKNYTMVNAFNPFYGVPLAGRLDEARLVYYCYDEIGAAHWAGQHGARLEKIFLQHVDSVIVSSQGLFEKKSKEHPHCHLVKNGVDYDLFAAQTPPSVSERLSQQFLVKIPKNAKIIGYLGSVDERLDYDLLENLIATTPQYHYVFVGRITRKEYENRLYAFPNVHLVGSQPPQDLPAWVGLFDTCLIPFVKNDLTAGIYPLKINEYLAAGKPVVATPFADLSDFASIITIADSAASFAFSFEHHTSTAAEKAKRQIFAAQNSWANKALTFADKF